MPKPLGENQLGVLQALRDLGGYPGRWNFGTRSQTVRILESLVKRGLVEKINTVHGPAYYRIAEEKGHVQ